MRLVGDQLFHRGGAGRIPMQRAGGIRFEDRESDAGRFCQRPLGFQPFGIYLFHERAAPPLHILPETDHLREKSSRQAAGKLRQRAVKLERRERIVHGAVGGGSRDAQMRAQRPQVVAGRARKQRRRQFVGID